MGVSTETPGRIGRPAKKRKAKSADSAPANGWQVTRDAGGWLTMSRPFEVPEERDILEVHSDWAGPVKLTENDGEGEQRFEVFLGRNPEADPLLDEEAAHEAERLVAEIVDRASAFAGQTMMAGWEPPSAEALAGHLHATGHETAIDKEQNLRLTLKRPGCDGQVRIERSPGRLRFALPLGRWTDLEPVAETAMRLVATDVNRRTRLVRIGWIPEAKASRCEAQVDLGGLPAGTNSNACRDALWREMVRMAVGGLELALRQLGLELPVLADPRHRELAEVLVALNLPPLSHAAGERGRG